MSNVGFNSVFIDDIYGDKAEVFVTEDFDNDVTDCENCTFVVLSTGDLQMTPRQARELADSLINAANHAEAQ